jgi:hypothetical protein
MHRLHSGWRLIFASILVMVVVERPMATVPNIEAPLTEAERKYVREYLPRALFWFAQWSGRDHARERLP